MVAISSIAQAQFPVPLSVTETVAARVDSAFPTQPGQAIAIVGMGQESQLHVFDGSNVTETYKDQFVRMQNALRVPITNRIFNEKTAHRAADVLFNVELLVGDSPTASHYVFDSGASGDVRYAQVFWDSSGGFTLMRDGLRYLRVGTRRIRNSVTGTSLSYNPCASIGATGPGCRGLATVDGNGNGFWVLLFREVSPNVFEYSLARFSFDAQLLEQQPLFRIGSELVSDQVLSFSRDISGVLHIAIASGATINALRIDDRNGFAITHSGQFACAGCNARQVHYAGVGEWIALAPNGAQINQRQYQLGAHVSGQALAPASLRFQSNFVGSNFQIETSLGGQSVVRYADSATEYPSNFRWTSANGNVIPTGNWQTADFGIGELLFVTKLIINNAEPRISANWLDENGVQVQQEDELVGVAPVNPIQTVPVFRADGQLHAVVEFPVGIQRAIEVWRIAVDGSVSVITRLPRAENLKIITSREPSNFVYLGYRNANEALTIQRVDLRTGIPTTNVLPDGTCQLVDALATNTSLLMQSNCEGSLAFYSLANDGFQFLDSTTAITSRFKLLDVQVGSPEIANVVRWSEASNQYIVYGVSATALVPRFLVPGPQIGLPILTADGGALQSTGTQSIYTKYRANLPPINAMTFCNTPQVDDGAGNFWTTRETSFGTDVCHTSTNGKLSIARTTQKLFATAAVVADNGDLVQVTNALVRYTPTGNSTVIASTPQPLAANLLGNLAYATNQQRIAYVQQREISENPLVSRLRNVLSVINMPAPPVAGDYLHFDGFEGDQ
jgi:hypothetical protein